MRCAELGIDIDEDFCNKQIKEGARICVRCETNKKEASDMAVVPKNRQCTDEDCEKFAVKDGLCTKHFRAKHGAAPTWGNKSKKVIKKAVIKKRVTKKDPPHRHPVMIDLQTLIKKAGREQVRAEIMPLIDDIKARLGEVESFLEEA